MSFFVHNAISNLSLWQFFSQTWMAKEATTELLSDVGVHLTRAFLTVLLNSVLSGSSYGRQTFLLVLVVGRGDVHSSMPTSLSLLIPSSTICHHSNWHLPYSIAWSRFPSRSHPNRNFTPLPGVCNKVLYLYFRKVLNKLNYISLSLSIPHIDQPTSKSNLMHILPSPADTHQIPLAASLEYSPFPLLSGPMHLGYI